MDWSSTDKLAVGLGSDVYIWNQKSKNATKLFSLSDITDSHFNATPITASDAYITSIKWMQDGSVLAVGNSDNAILIWDVEKDKCVIQIKQHNSRIAALAWNVNLLSSGSLSGNIINHDIRQVTKVNELSYHTREVCGLKWSSNGRFLASGADDCLVCIWDISASSLSPASHSSSMQPFKVLREHKAAVKAIDWCSWQNNLLATGGGKADGTIKIWNVYNENNQIKNIETNSQISGLLWSSKNRELLSSHGYNQNNLTMWKYPNMEKLGELNGHTNRILSMALSANGEIVASLGADQTIRFWECFKVAPHKPVYSTCTSSLGSLTHIQNIR